LIAHIDGGSRGNPGPSGYGVVIEDEKGQSVAELSEYLGRQTNNFAEYQGLIAALEYAVQHGHKGLKVISDSELLVRQIQGGYRVHHPVLRDKNQVADRLANAAMDKGQGKTPEPSLPTSSFVGARELKGVVRNGKIELLDGELSDGTRVRVRVIGQEA